MVFLYALKEYQGYLDVIEQRLQAASIAYTRDQSFAVYADSFSLSQAVLAHDSTPSELSIIVDADTVIPFNYLNKLGKTLCAPGYDEHSARMTRDHNGTQILAIGAEVTSPVLAGSIALAFAQGQYAGGRHQVRVDMLHQLTKGGC